MNIKIRKWNIEDAGKLAAALSNKKVLDNLRDGLPYPYTEKDAEEYINAMLNSDQNSTFAYAVEVDGVAVGSIGAFRQGNIHFRTAELGYYLDERYWGQGIMTEAVKQFCGYIFENSKAYYNGEYTLVMFYTDKIPLNAVAILEEYGKKELSGRINLARLEESSKIISDCHAILTIGSQLIRNQ